jgi:hypothetical protein
MIRKVHFAVMAGVLSAGLLMLGAPAAQTFELARLYRAEAANIVPSRYWRGRARWQSV